MLFPATRRKAQTIRHNIVDMRKLPNLICAHSHDPNEWKPIRQSDKSVYYPSREESEYTAALVFTIAVACSFWAIHQGFTKLRVSRLPPVECSGDRASWLQLPPDTFREKAMISAAIQIGLLPRHAQQRGCPRRVHVADELSSDRQMPAVVVYVGYGHFKHRLPVTEWVNPFKGGVDGSHAAVFMRFLDHWEVFQTQHSLAKLEGKRLARDCLPHEQCHADILVAYYYQQFILQAAKSRCRASLPHVGFARLVTLTPALMSQASAQLYQIAIPISRFLTSSMANS